MGAGRDTLGAGYECVLGEMLAQGNNYAHVPARRLVWMQAAQPMLQVLQWISYADSEMQSFASDREL